MSLQCEDWKYFKMAATIKMADLVLMLRCIRGDTVCMPVHFGVDEKLYIEVRLDASRRRKKVVPTVTPTRYDVAERFP